MTRRGDALPKTHAKSLFCLSDKDLAGLEHEERRNPRAPRGPPMQLYNRAQLEALSHRKWGGPAGLAVEQRKREERRASRNTAAAAADDAPLLGGSTGDDVQMEDALPALGASASTGGPYAQLRLPPLVSERVRKVLPLLAQPQHPVAASPGDSGAQQPQAQAQDEGGSAAAAGASTSAGSGGGGVNRGEFVLYWMASAVRGHENPALDVARAAAAQLRLPLVVAAFVLGCSPYASQRRVKFLLEGLRDAQLELRAQGQDLLVYMDGASGGEGAAAAAPAAPTPYPYPWHGACSAAVDAWCREGGQGPLPSGPGWAALVALARRAALVVTDCKRLLLGPVLALPVAVEDMPVDPDAAWLAALALELTPAAAPGNAEADTAPPGPCCDAPQLPIGACNSLQGQQQGCSLGSSRPVGLWAVDTACVVPMRLVGKAYERAYSFRAATQQLRRVRTRTMYASAPPPAYAASGDAGPSFGGGPAPASAAAAALQQPIAALAASPAAVYHGPASRVPAADTSGLGAVLLPASHKGDEAAAVGGVSGTSMPGTAPQHADDADADMDMDMGPGSTAPMPAPAAEQEQGQLACPSPSPQQGSRPAPDSQLATAQAHPRRLKQASLESFLQHSSPSPTPPAHPRPASASHPPPLVCGVPPSAVPAVQREAPAAAAAAALLGSLGWTPLDLSATSLDLGALTASRPEFDQSVPAVAHLVGGSRAGYARWQAWRANGGLSGYAATRNDALQRNGVSRLSAYLHWGMVSPFRVAREAAASGGPGAGKYLDELLVWRELSYAFCLYRYPSLTSLAVLPRWAQDTLAAHAGDPRVEKTLEQLECGNTGDAFWDAAQGQLVATGELHNNVRMTWGKAVLPWCVTPAAALRTTLHLNHRYALDGCDPASYGGVLWCFGLFDGPKESAATRVSGSLRTRPTGVHARRLPPAAYRALPP